MYRPSALFPPIPPAGVVLSGGYGMPSNVPNAAITTKNTLTSLTNKNLAHVCDISADVRRTAAWKYLQDNVSVRAARTALKAYLTARGILPTAITTSLTEKVKKIKEVLQQVNKFLKFVKAVADALIYYIIIVRAVINWIMSLPAMLLQMAKECAFAFFKSIISLGDDLLGSSGSGILGPEFKTLTTEMKSTFNEAKAVFRNTLALAQIPGQVLNATLNTNISLNPTQALAAVDAANQNLITVLASVPSQSVIDSYNQDASATPTATQPKAERTAIV
jgi:hypothetical protein